jgi:hypothetical protein
MPVFGSCAGMIMLSGRLADPASGQRPAASGQEALSAIDMTVRRNAFGRQADSFETDLSIAGLHGGPGRGVFIRAPWAERVGEDAEALAAEPRTGKFVAVRQGPALSTAFHPELTTDRRIHELFINTPDGDLLGSVRICCGLPTLKRWRRFPWAGCGDGPQGARDMTRPAACCLGLGGTGSRTAMISQKAFRPIWSGAESSS